MARDFKTRPTVNGVNVRIATDDMTASEILTAIKTVDGSGSGLDADLLDGSSSSSFAAASHAATHTNGTDDVQSATASQKGLMTSAYASKLDGIETGATADQTAAEILTAIKTVDGSGSGLDADLLDSHDTSYFATATGLSDHLADTSDAHDASAISVLDTGAYYTGSDVEAVLAEIAGTALPAGLMNAVEVNLGTTPRRAGHFDITTTGLTTGRNVIIEQINGPYTNKGTQADEAEMDQLTVSGQAISSTVIRCYWTSPTFVRGNIKFAYTLVSTLNTVPEATVSTPGLLKSAFQETHIEGLNLVWNTPGTNGTNLTVTSGSAWIPSLSAVVNVPSDLTGPSMTFAASTWYYVYLTSLGALEISTTAPAAAYKGTARTKTGDTSRRFVGAVLSDAAGTPTMRQFAHIGREEIIYPSTSLVSPYRIINGVGQGASGTTQSLATVCPPGVTTQIFATATAGIGSIVGNTFIELHMIGVSRVGIAGGMISTANGFLFTSGWFPVNSTTPDIHYSTTGPVGSAFYLDIAGYKFVR